MGCLLLQWALLKELLFTGSVTLAHDNLQWGYSAFHFFARSLWDYGEVPFWNPYSHLGEPFYPILVQFRFLEPISIALISLFSLISDDTLLAFHWHRYFLSFVTTLGAYGFLRGFTSCLWVRCLLAPLLLFSPVFWSCFQQDGFLNQFLWIPYVAWILRVAIQKERLPWPSWLVLCVLVGWSFQSYFFSGMAVFLLFFGMGAVYFRRWKWNVKKALAGLAIGVLMSGPNLALMQKQGEFVFPLRIHSHHEGLLGKDVGKTLLSTPSTTRLSYEQLTVTGAAASEWDWFHLLTGEGNRFFFRGEEAWGWSSEAYLYFGILGLVFFLMGVFWGIQKEARVWLFVLVGSGLLCLGNRAWIHWILYSLFPPLWWTRNVHAFVGIATLGMLICVVRGSEVVSQAQKSERADWKWVSIGALVVAAAFAVLPLFKYPIHWGFPLPLLFVAALGWWNRKRATRLTFFLATLGGFGLAVLITTGINAPDRMGALVLRWTLLGALPYLVFLHFQRRGVSSVPWVVVLFLTGDLIEVKHRALRVLPDSSGLIADTQPSLRRQVFPDSYSGCPADKHACVHYASLLELKPTIFPSAYTAVPNQVSDPPAKLIEWGKQNRLHNAFFLQQRYLKLLQSSSKDLVALTHLNQPTPWRCLPNRPKDLPALANQLSQTKAPGCQVQAVHQSPNQVQLNIATDHPGWLHWAELAGGGDWQGTESVAGFFKGAELQPGQNEFNFVYDPPFRFAAILFWFVSLACLSLAVIVALLPRHSFNGEMEISTV